MLEIVPQWPPVAMREHKAKLREVCQPKTGVTDGNSSSFSLLISHFHMF